jgi:cytoskeleton-associated protein 5
MGKPFEKQSKYFVLPVATVLADQKAPIRAAAVQTLTAIATACEGVESMVHGLTTALESSNPVQKASLLNWTLDWFKHHAPPSNLDLSNWAAPIVSCLDDRNGDVRKAAQAMLPALILCSGFDYVLQQASSLKPASRASAIPLIQAARPAAAPPAPVPPATKSAGPKATDATDVDNLATSGPESPTAVGNPAAAPPGPKLTGVRRKLPTGTSQPESRSETPTDPSSRIPGKPVAGLKRPGPSAPAAAVKPLASQTPALSLPFISMNAEARKARLAKDGTRWVNEGGTTRKDLADLLQHQMEPHASKELIARLFSQDHNAVNDHMLGLTTMADLFSRAETDHDIEEIKSVCLANFDLPLKYASIKLHESQPNLIAKCLDTVDAVLAFLRSINYQLTDAEALCFIPTMVYKVIV